MGYSIKDVRDARAYIKTTLANSIFKDRGGNNLDFFDYKDLEDIFDLYDNVFFHNQIRKRVAKLGAGLTFYSRDRNSGAGGICSIERDGEECIYYIDIAPKILDTIFESKKPGCEDRLECLLLVFEHQIIHLLMVLWGYEDQEYSAKDSIYGEHGALFRCMSKSYFQHTHEHDLGETIRSKTILSQSRTPITFGYAYWSNSCYLDSLMTVLLGNIDSFWRDSILTFDTLSIEYHKGVCLTLGSSKKIQEHAKKIQDQIRLGLNELGNVQTPSKSIKCLVLRNLLYTCLPDMKENGWVTYNVAAIYGALADFFPSLEIDYPRKLYRPKGNRYVSDPVSYEKRVLFQMWEYMDPLDNIERGTRYEKILWDQFESPIIVFYNGGTPHIKIFDEDGEEYVHSADGNRESVITKIRSFGPKIINDRYELVGVITLQGVTKDGGGTHYVAHLMGMDGEWYYYNDLSQSGRMTRVNNLPERGVWKEIRGDMPSMYFYRKVT